MSFPMSSVPKFEPPAILASVILIINTEAFHTSTKLLLGPLHHVRVVLGVLVVEEGDGGERGR